ncbi:MAG: hypothetical protein DRJ03_31655, partial [Chloroflexi bacterium]
MREHMREKMNENPHKRPDKTLRKICIYMQAYTPYGSVHEHAYVATLLLLLRFLRIAEKLNNTNDNSNENTSEETLKTEKVTVKVR